ncbi:bifunctional glycosyltransferase family 2/GtrA family protein [Clostridium sp. E02]|uniref:bifunctional glycosyltransferase family 2/GtrA family protein n=1 Tax=Clostridium sp. E02 TaxID=2487134 RepID=UPI000F53A169|nr:bifunctional glycosyltransferase family 2/GtrA family protein [Clostridium sp. E02]
MTARNHTIVIPAYEPDDRMIALLQELNEKSAARLIVVNDGSSKESDSVFRKAEDYARILTHDKNYGKGKAIKTALNFIQKDGEEGGIVLADADGQHVAEDILLLLDKIFENKSALLLGIRNFTGKLPLRSRIGNQFTKVTFRLISGKGLKDTQTGLRAFHTSLIPVLLSVPGDRYEYETNVLFQCVEEGVEIVEVPIQTIYLDGNASSHFRIIQDSIRIYRNMFRFASSSLISFCLDYILYGIVLSVTTLQGIPSAEIVSNITARVVSASMNFYLNKRFVFRHQGGLFQTGFRYAILALSLLCVNTVILVWLVEEKGFHGMTAKAMVELFLFFLSFLLQKRMVFKKKH